MHARPRELQTHSGTTKTVKRLKLPVRSTVYMKFCPPVDSCRFIPLGQAHKMWLVTWASACLEKLYTAHSHGNDNWAHPSALHRLSTSSRYACKEVQRGRQQQHTHQIFFHSGTTLLCAWWWQWRKVRLEGRHHPPVCANSLHHVRHTADHTWQENFQCPCPFNLNHI